MMTTYTKNVSEPWFSLIKIGAKKCEGRLKKGDFDLMKKGDTIIFENNEFDFPRSFRCKITSVHHYPSFKTYLETETLERCLPGIDTVENGVSIYHKYYKEEDEIKVGVNAFRLRVSK